MAVQRIEQELVDKNRSAEIFSIPVVADELERIWKLKRAQIREVAIEIEARKPSCLLFFASGGSAAALYSGYYSLLHYSAQPSIYLISPEVVSASPARLGKTAVAIGASYSGRTVDTLAARDWLCERGVPLFSITRKADAELARGATWSLAYDSIALFSSPALMTLLLTVELCRAGRQWSAEVESLEQALESLPDLIRKIQEPSRQLAEHLAPKFVGKLLVLSGGGTYSLGHMMAFDMFGEYLKRYCSFIHYGEFRHGPLEIVRQGEPTMMLLMGNDRSRPFAEATLNFGRRNGANTIVFDAAELAPHAHGMLDALVLYPSQIWLLYYLACQGGIDLEQYKYMHITPFTEGDTFY